MNHSHEDDLHNFSASPAHRLPTLNGTQALQAAFELQKPISTGLSVLDDILSDHDENNEKLTNGGIDRGTVTEIYGPPGVGKTTFAIQLTARLLKDDVDAKMVWIDTCADVSINRLNDFVNYKLNASDVENNSVRDAASVSAPHSEDYHHNIDVIDNITHLHISSFPHLLALLLHPSQDFPPKGTKLLVLDNLSSIATTGLPQRKYEPIQDLIGIPSSTATHSDAVTPSRLDPANIISKSLSARRLAMIASISAGLQRLAASRNIAVVVLNKAAINTSSRTGNKTIIRSVMGYQQWNENITTRIVIYRDHWPHIDWQSLTEDEARNRRKIRTFPLRIAEVERLGGVDVSADGIRFVILKQCLHAIDSPKSKIVKIKIPAPESPIPEDLEDDGNDGLQDIDLADIGDQIPTEPEDIAAPVSQYDTRTRKRKTMEVQDSEEEEGEDVESSQARLPPMPNARGGFLPSSQLIQDVTSDVESPLMKRHFVNAKDIDFPSGDSDMLLQ